MRRRGFTLIEIMVVVAIVAVLSAMAVPSMFDSFARATLRDEAQRLYDTVRYAQRMATTKRRTLRLVLRPSDPAQADRSTYRLELAVTDLDAAETFAEVVGTPVKPAVLPDGLRLLEVQLGTWASELGGEAGALGLRFFADGSNDGAVIQLGNERAVRSIVIDAETGQVDLIEGPTSGLPPMREDLDA